MIIPTARLRRLAGALCATALVACGAPWAASPVVHAQDQVLFMSATGDDGVPVTDLTPEEVMVQWDSKDSEIRNLESIDWPVKVTVYVDNSERDALEGILAGVKALLGEIPAGVEVGLASIADKIEWVTEHTTDKAALIAGVDAIERNNKRTKFLDALVEEAGKIAADTDRNYFPVVVMVTTDHDDRSDGEQALLVQMVTQMQTNAATVHTRIVMTEKGKGEESLQARVGSIGGQSMQGTYQVVPASTEVSAALTTLGQDIARKHRLVSQQYRVTYRPPSDVSAQPVIAVGARDGLNVVPTLDGNLP